MGALSIYLMPEMQIEPEVFRSTVKRVLLQMGIIKDVNYGGTDWWVAGSSSGGIFENGDDEEIGFEYCILYASEHVDIVPQDAAEFPSCPACGVSVSDQFYDVLNDIEDEYSDKAALKAKALKVAAVECSECGRKSLITHLTTDVGIFLSGTWVNFEDPPGSLHSEWLEKFNAATGWRNRCLEYWYT